MSTVWQAIKNNPVRVYSLIIAFIALCNAFGLVLSPDQRASLLGLTAVILGGGEVVTHVQKVQGAAEGEPEMGSPSEPPL